MPLLDIGIFILSSLSRPQKGWTLSIDRTNWKFGKTHINILTIGVVVNGIEIPVVWKALPQKTKRGNSDTAQCIEIIEELLKIMPVKLIYALTIDREFIGKKWLKWLDDQGVPFIVRIKKNHQVNGMRADELRHQKRYKSLGVVNIWGLKFYYDAKPIHKGRDSHLYVISNKFEAKYALKMYKQRWAIELLFSHLKKRGFNSGQSLLKILQIKAVLLNTYTRS